MLLLPDLEPAPPVPSCDFYVLASSGSYMGRLHSSFGLQASTRRHKSMPWPRIVYSLFMGDFFQRDDITFCNSSKSLHTLFLDVLSFCVNQLSAVLFLALH